MIHTIGRIAGEGGDRKVADDFNLSVAEQELIHSVSTAFHAKNKKVVVILNVGGSVETVSWRGEVDAILSAWQPGQEAGNAIADVLTGKTNPSGKLASTFLAKYEDDPTAASFPGKATGPVNNDMIGFPTQPMDAEYSEGIYVGYRAFDKQKIKPAFEFGFGKSYTTFAYSDLKMSGSTVNNGKIKVSITVKNTGKTAGKEIAQLYVSAPSKELDKPKQELKGFGKTKLLKPNESQVLSFELDARSLASFDEKTSAWVAEKGKYEIRIGASSRDIRAKKTYSLAKNQVVETVTKVF